jgi:ABC-type transport system involved in multi-copper enzyme maturation permease subunit
MIALLKKDWRVFRTPVIGGLVALVTPYVVGIISAIMDEHDRRPIQPDNFLNTIAAACFVSLWLSGVMAAVFGGAAFAQERRDRSADFLAMLPASRTRIVASKLLVAFGCVLGMWLLNIAVLAVLVRLSPRNPWPPPENFLIVASTTLMFFGIAWTCSALLSSPAIAASISIAITVASMVLLTMQMQSETYSQARAAHWQFIMELWTLCAGVASLIAGTLYYLRRVEP